MASVRSSEGRGGGLVDGEEEGGSSASVSVSASLEGPSPLSAWESLGGKD